MRFLVSIQFKALAPCLYLFLWSNIFKMVLAAILLLFFVCVFLVSLPEKSVFTYMFQEKIKDVFKGFAGNRDKN